MQGLAAGRRSRGSLPFLIVGNPDHRRTLSFREALVARGHPEPRVISWLSILEDVRVLAGVPDERLFVRIDTYGQDFDVERRLLARGYDDARAADVCTLSPAEIDALRPDKGRILAPRQRQMGVERALDDIGRVLAAKRAWTTLASPASVRELFDKRVTSKRYGELGIPVPRALAPTDTPAALTARMRESGTRAVFVKLSSGSSASCLGIYEDSRAGGSFTTTMEVARQGAGASARLYNSRRLRRYERGEASRLLDFLLREGSHVEERVPKARLEGEYFDCRVIVIAGEPAFTVVRRSTHEITNLHLGGKRGDPAMLARAAPPEILAAAMESCARVGRAHDCFQVGVDVMFEEGWKGHRVLEANAFGDFFPNLTRDGLSVYEWEIRALEQRSEAQR